MNEPPDVDDQVTQPQGILVCAAHSEPEPVPHDQEGSDDEARHACEVEDLIDIARQLAQTQSDMDHDGSKQPFGHEHYWGKPDQCCVVLCCGNEGEI